MLLNNNMNSPDLQVTFPFQLTEIIGSFIGLNLQLKRINP